MTTRWRAVPVLTLMLFLAPAAACTWSTGGVRPSSDASAAGKSDGPSFAAGELSVAWSDREGNELPDGVGEADPPLVVNTIQGPSHCDWQSVVLMHLAVPVGEATTRFDDVRQYVRDPHGLFRGSLAGEFVAHARPLPPDAEPTGFVNGDIELWIARSTFDRAVYVGRDGRFEEWPRALQPVACG